MSTDNDARTRGSVSVIASRLPEPPTPAEVERRRLFREEHQRMVARIRAEGDARRAALRARTLVPSVEALLDFAWSVLFDPYGETEDYRAAALKLFGLSEDAEGL